MERIDHLERMQWSSRSRGSKGPKRMCRFCLLAILVPILCLCVPLYIRFQALRPHFFTLSPADMKLLNQESRVSTVWCQGQELRMNGSFNAYLLSERPTLQRYRQHVKMRRNMILEDDIKEYWGFYLLKGSFVRLSVCSRHEGASFIVVKGLKDARRCAYLGELDSAEESDEISQEFEFSHEITRGNQSDFEHMVSAQVNNAMNGTNSHQILSPKIMDLLKRMNPIKKQALVRALLEQLYEDPNSEESLVYAQARSKFAAYQIKSPQNEPINMVETTTARESRQTGPGDPDPWDDPADQIDGNLDAGMEVVDDVLFDYIPQDMVYDLHDQGRFDQRTDNDESREEVRSSWSSSEEALAACEGLMYNVPLNGATQCHRRATEEDLNSIQTEISFEVSQTGFYYFIFANENEIMDNFLYATFDLRKTVFDVSSNSLNCTNATICELPLSFWSDDHVVVEVPGEEADPCDALVGFSSLSECHRVILAQSICQPRKSIYMTFLLLVPVFILVFAYI
eukprot:maker-scaffold1424_size42081-snap-gene-0.12 protein:Tk00099 transcript:maker-scaffold1424_size42081-snap-gene-0.12-mRNA-1 annotation:"hypothetical protein DAPPUDRAFT_299891"